MNRTFFRIGVAMSALLFTTSCVNENFLNNLEDSSITIETSIDALTRKPSLNTDGSGHFSKDDVITLFISGDGKTVRKNYTIGSKLYWNDLGLSGDMKQVTFAGCYPTPTSKISDSKFTFNVSSASEKDLLLAKGVEVTKTENTNVNLSFRHAMHKLVINYTSDVYSENELKNITTICTAVSSCEVDMATAIVKPDSSKTSDFVGKGKNVSLLLIPQSTKDITLTIKKSGGETIKETILSDLKNVLKNPSIVNNIPDSLESGKCLTLNLKLNKDGIVVETSQIGAWENQGTINGEIEI